MELPGGQIEIFKWLKYGEKVLSSKGGPSITRLYFKCSHGVNTEKGRAGFLCPARKIVDVRTEDVNASNAPASPDNPGSCTGPSTSSPSSSTSASSGGDAPASPSSHAHTTTTFRHSHNHQTLASSWVNPRRGMAAAARCTSTTTTGANAASNAASGSAGAAQLTPTSGTAASLTGQKRRWSSMASICDGLEVAVTAAPMNGSAACYSQSQSPAAAAAASTVVADKTTAALPIRPVAVRCLEAPMQSTRPPISVGSRGAFTAVINVARGLTNAELSSAVSMHAPMKRDTTSGESMLQSPTTGSGSTMSVSGSLSQPVASALTPSDSSKMMSSPLTGLLSKSSTAATSLLQQASVPVTASETLRLSRSPSQSSAVTTLCVPRSAGGGAAFANSGWTANPVISTSHAVALLRAPLSSSAPDAGSPIESTLSHWRPSVKPNHAS
ncbi:unnamed protein product, partial [Closterium sp. NIES-54]